ncbi:hypothetical protein A5676_15290, partial [Mycobacterium malmoense]
AAAAAAARAGARARRRRRATQRDHGDEFADMNVDVDPDWGAPADELSAAASDRGAARLGFAGTAHGKAAARATGLTALADEFGSGPRLPMLPGGWDSGGGTAPDRPDAGRR